MVRTKYQDLKIVLHYPKEMDDLEIRLAQWIGNTYGILLEELRIGKIHPMIFYILSDEEFYRCFGRSKEELEEFRV